MDRTRIVFLLGALTLLSYFLMIAAFSFEWMTLGARASTAGGFAICLTCFGAQLRP